MTTKRRWIETDPAFYRSVMLLAIPLMLQSILSLSVTTVDSIMLGHMSEISMSAANIANQPFNIVSGIIRGLAVGSGVMIAQYWGKQDKDSIKQILAIVLRINVVASLVCAIVSFAFPAQLMSLFTSSKEIAQAGVVYLRIISLTYVLFAFSLTYQLALRSMEDARTPLFINLITYGSNMLLNYCLIFGKFGLPELGITGAAIGTLIARGIEIICYLIHMLALDKKLCMGLQDFWLKSKDLTRDLVRYGMPSLLSEMVFTIGLSMYTLIFGHLGTAATSANTIVTMATRVSEVLQTGVSGAAAVLIGKTIGKGDMDKIRPRGAAFNVMTMGVAVLAGVIIIFGKDWLMSLYNVSAETYDLTMQMIMISVVMMPAIGYEFLYVCGTLVGGGDTNFIFWYTTIIMWCITMPLAFLGAFVFKWPVWVVFLILRADYLIKSIVGYIRYRGNKWIKEVTVKK